MLEAVKQNGHALYSPGRAEGRPRDRAGGRKQDGVALYYASAALKDDREIVLEAVKQNGMR